jgi:hypothetical protein
MMVGCDWWEGGAKGDVESKWDPRVSRSVLLSHTSPDVKTISKDSSKEVFRGIFFLGEEGLDSRRSLGIAQMDRSESQGVHETSSLSVSERLEDGNASFDLELGRARRVRTCRAQEESPSSCRSSTGRGRFPGRKAQLKTSATRMRNRQL